MTSILRQSYGADLTTKTSKTNGFDTIEIDLVRSPEIAKFKVKELICC